MNTRHAIYTVKAVESKQSMRLKMHLYNNILNAIRMRIALHCIAHSPTRFRIKVFVLKAQVSIDIEF